MFKGKLGCCAVRIKSVSVPRELAVFLTKDDRRMVVNCIQESPLQSLPFKSTIKKFKSFIETLPYQKSILLFPKETSQLFQSKSFLQELGSEPKRDLLFYKYAEKV